MIAEFLPPGKICEVAHICPEKKCWGRRDDRPKDLSCWLRRKLLTASVSQEFMKEKRFAYLIRRIRQRTFDRITPA